MHYTNLLWRSIRISLLFTTKNLLLRPICLLFFWIRISCCLFSTFYETGVKNKRFLAEEKYLLRDYSFLVPYVRPPQPLPSVYSVEEIQQVEAQVRNDAINGITSVGKRNYAMLLMAARLGLRPCDIVSLTFSELDFQAETIRIIQKKQIRCWNCPCSQSYGKGSWLPHRSLSAVVSYFLLTNIWKNERNGRKVLRKMMYSPGFSLNMLPLPAGRLLRRSAA